VVLVAVLLELLALPQAAIRPPPIASTTTVKISFNLPVLS
jgi:hypothetical protein